MIGVLAAGACGRTADGTRAVDRERRNKLETYCGLLAVKLKSAAATLESLQASADLRRETADALAGISIVPIEIQVSLCTGGPETWPDSERCWSNHDYPCLARLARAASTSVEASMHELERERENEH